MNRDAGTTRTEERDENARRRLLETGQVNETWEELRGVDGGVQKGVCDSPTCRFRRKEGNGWPLSETISDFFHALCNILGNINEYHVVIIFV